MIKAYEVEEDRLYQSYTPYSNILRHCSRGIEADTDLAENKHELRRLVSGAMSRRYRGDSITVTVIRSSSANKEEVRVKEGKAGIGCSFRSPRKSSRGDLVFFYDQISISLKRSLNDLKTAISQSPKLGSIPPKNQRLFFLGRELKTNGRSLEGLGVGNFGIHAVHLHSSLPSEPQAPKNKRSVQKSVAQKQQQQPYVVDLAESSDDDDECIIVEDPPSKRRRVVS